MSKLLKKRYLYMICGLIIVGSSFPSILFGENITIDLGSLTSRHEPRVYSLYFSQNSSVGMTVEEDQLLVTNGIVIGDSSSLSQSTATSIGGGRNNIIYGDSTNAGIAGGQGNSISLGENSTIGGGMSNTIEGRGAVIAGGEENMGFEGGSVVGGRGNSANSGGVVLGGMYNKAGVNSLALGSNASGNYNSFAWSATTDVNSARIDANNGILIGTTETLSGVNLVVNGGIKLGGTDALAGIAGEIRVVNGCFYGYDGLAWHILNRNSTGNCGGLPSARTCKFGNVELQEGDEVTAYNKTVSPSCTSKLVKCTNGELVDINDSSNTDFKYAYCYPGSSPTEVVYSPSSGDPLCEEVYVDVTPAPSATYPVSTSSCAGNSNCVLAIQSDETRNDWGAGGRVGTVYIAPSSSEVVKVGYDADDYCDSLDILGLDWELPHSHKSTWTDMVNNASHIDNFNAAGSGKPDHYRAGPRNGTTAGSNCKLGETGVSACGYESQSVSLSVRCVAWVAYSYCS